MSVRNVVKALNKTIISVNKKPNSLCVFAYEINFANGEKGDDSSILEPLIF